jgi:hypothetical protein
MSGDHPLPWRQPYHNPGCIEPGRGYGKPRRVTTAATIPGVVCVTPRLSTFFEA